MTPSRSGKERSRKVLVVSTVDEPESSLRSQVRDGDTLKVVVPVVGQGVLDWLANDESAFSHAQDVADRTADELPGDIVEAVAGESDVELAIRDALATFPAEEIVIVVRPPDQRGVVEAGATEYVPAGSFDGIPVRRVVITEPGEGMVSPDPVAGAPPGGAPETTRSEEDTPTTRSARTPVRALGGTVVVIAVTFLLALSLAALAYALAR